MFRLLVAAVLAGGALLLPAAPATAGPIVPGAACDAAQAGSSRTVDGVGYVCRLVDGVLRWEPKSADRCVGDGYTRKTCLPPSSRPAPSASTSTPPKLPVTSSTNWPALIAGSGVLLLLAGWALVRLTGRRRGDHGAVAA